MSDKGIWVEGEKQLFLNLQKRMDMNTSTARKALRKAALNFIADAKENIRSNGSNAGGMLRPSGKVQAVEGDPDSFDAGFFAQEGNSGYAYYVEYGTKGGGKRTIKVLMPNIIAWLKKKTSVKRGTYSAFESAAAFEKMSPEKYLKQIAYFISRSIVKKGTKPHPFFRPALEKNEQAFVDAISEDVRRENK